MNPAGFLHEKFLGNTVESYIWTAGILVVGYTLKRLLSGQASKLVYALFKRYGRNVGVQKFQQLMVRPFELLFTLLIVFLAFDRLVFPDAWKLVPREQFGFRLIIADLFNAAMILSLTWIVLRMTDFIALIFIARAKQTETLTDDQLVSFVKEGVKVIIVVIGFFILVGVVFRLDIVSLVTGLGIGGLAIALAAKETLENLLGSFTIFLDKPFVTGDSVKVGSIEGKVENVGFRSTRIRALDKMIVTVPNKKMIDAELINETDREVRRSSFPITLSYETTEGQVRSILDDITQLINENPLIEHGTETVRFRSFSPTGLELLITFIVLSPENEDYLRVQEEINFRIMDIVRKNNASFAVPSYYLKEAGDTKQAFSLSSGKA